MEFTAKSGAKIVINLAPWEDAKRLKKAIQRQVSSTGIDFKASLGDTLSKLFYVDSSDEVDAALWPCLIRCLYNGQKITPATFESKEGRGDYYSIVVACARENLGPLVESLYFELLASGLINPSAAAPASE